MPLPIRPQLRRALPQFLLQNHLQARQAGATVVLGGLTIWSGVDTNRARDEYDGNPTEEGLDDGKSKQKRTNILLAGTAVAGVATAVIGVFFTNWKGEKKPTEAPESAIRPLIGPGFVGAEGVF